MKKVIKFPKTTFVLFMGLTACSPLLAYDMSSNSTVDANNNPLTNDVAENNDVKIPFLNATVNEIANPKEVTSESEQWNWADNERRGLKNRLNQWAHKMNGWFGEPDPNDPASASLRIILDTRWEDDPIEGSDVTVEPRVRGRLKLPVLEERLSIIIGDDDLDDETFLQRSARGQNYYLQTSSKDKTIDRKQVREDNASIGLRWSNFEEALGLQTDVDLGVRSGDDVYIKFEVDKRLYETDDIFINSDNYYRYGSQSEHFVKGGLNFRYDATATRFINNNIKIEYSNEDDTERTSWYNDLRQVHDFGNNKQLSYGLSASGDFKGDDEQLNSYGPAISYRQPIWRKWLFVQTDLNYYNDKAADKDHYPAGLLRFEALF